MVNKVMSEKNTEPAGDVDSHDSDKQETAMTVALLVAALITPIAATIASTNPSPWSGKRSLHCVATGTTAILGGAAGAYAFWSAVAMLCVAGLFGMVDGGILSGAMTMLAWACMAIGVLHWVTAGIAAAAWCEGCANDRRMGEGSEDLETKGFVVGAPMAVYGTVSEPMHNPPTVMYDRQL